VRGAAYRVAETAWPAAYAYLREREQPTETYVEARVAVRLEDGRRVAATTFLSDVAHPQWAGVLDAERQARLIAGARGLSGRNLDYLSDLVDHLRGEGIRDRTMEKLRERVVFLEAARPGSGAT
jgi:cation transport protein ChaC